MFVCTHARSLLHLLSSGCQSGGIERVAEVCVSSVAELGRGEQWLT